MSKRDFYDVLGVAKTASDADIKKAYRKAAMDSHPDRNQDDPKAEANFKDINAAYEVLKDSEKKAAYDAYGHAAFEGGGGGGAGFNARDFGSAFHDIFDDLYKNFGGGGRERSYQSRGADLRYNMTIDLEDAFHGKSERLENIQGTVPCNLCDGTGGEDGSKPSKCPTCNGMGKVRAQQGFFTMERACPTCSGQGQIVTNPCKACLGTGKTSKPRTLNVKIPPGVETGTRIRLSGEGEAGERGGSAGDLYIFIQVSDHNLFEREGAHLYCAVPISITQATLGGEVEIPNIDGGRSRVKIPSGTQTGKQLRLTGKGMPILNGAGTGDLYLELVVETPINLTAKQKDLLKDFAKETAQNNPQGENFFGKVKKFWEEIKS